MNEAQLFRYRVGLLRKHFPGLAPVTARRRRPPVADDVGGIQATLSCLGTIQRFEIQVKPRQCNDMMLDTLIHEWAHMLAWDARYDPQKHGPAWGVAYAELYTFFEDKGAI